MEETEDRRTKILKDLSSSWSLYFPFDPFDPTLPWVSAALLFRKFFESEQGSKLLEGFDIETATDICFDYKEFVELLPEELCGFAGVLKSNASVTLACFGLALCSLRKRRTYLDGLAPVHEKIKVRFINYARIQLVNLKSNCIGQFVSVRGTVVRVAGLAPLVKRMNFTCTRCGTLITKDIPDGKFQTPTYCEGPDCKSRTFKPEKDSALTVDYQKIRLQEIEDEENQMDPGRVPRAIDIELSEELVDLVVPGDCVNITGIVKALNVESLSGRGSRAKGKGKESSLLVLLIEANAIENKICCFMATNRKNSHRSTQLGQQNTQMQEPIQASTQSDSDSVKSDLVANLNLKDYQMISTIATRYGFEFLVYSLCPLIYGHEHVKAGLLLALTGGTGAHDNSHFKGSVPVRPDIHVLVVGDPGLGKSQMLQAASTVSPRGVYVCGNTASKSGLTVTFVKDQTGEFSLEAGALVMADRGACCIDEFDKMPGEHAALLETMEQQSISIAKAGIVCTLSARTTILAAANPKGGNYKRSKTILENLNMSAPLLSRFDLIFILVDRPDEGHDQIIADHVVFLHSGSNMDDLRASQNAHGLRKRKYQESNNNMNINMNRNSATDGSKPLKLKICEKILKYNEIGQDPLPKSMLRKYLAYAKQYCHPTLSVEACRVIQEFYLELREKGSSCDSTPITTRQLDSLIRLAQARAKIELREIVSEEDAKDIVSLMKDTLLDAYTDESGHVDYARSGGMTMAKLCKAFIVQLKRVMRKYDRGRFTIDQLKEEARAINVLHQIPDFREFIDVLNQQAYLLKKPNGMYECNTY